MEADSKIQKCPKCGRECRGERTTDWFERGFTVFGVGAGGILGTPGGPGGIAAGAAIGGLLMRKITRSYNDDLSEFQMHKFKCPDCNITWKASLKTGRHNSWTPLGW